MLPTSGSPDPEENDSMKRFAPSWTWLYAACSAPSGPVRRVHGDRRCALEGHLDPMSLRASIPFR